MKVCLCGIVAAIVLILSLTAAHGANIPGTVKWSYDTGYAFEACSPAIGTDGTIYTGSVDSMTVYAFSSTGKLMWHFTAKDGIGSSPAIGKDGTVYAASWDNKVYALASSSKGLANSAWPMFHHDLRHRGDAGGLFALAVTPGSSGAVTSSPSGIDCGSTCAAFYKKGTKVTLTPTPDSDNVFIGWTGACKGNGTCTITMTKDLTLGATFEAGSCTYTLSSSAKTLSYKGGTIKIGVTASKYHYCLAPVITNNNPDWINYTASAFAKNKGSITITIPEYDSASGRSGGLSIGGKTLMITQKGQP